jgi:hypothetical protein
MHIVSKAAIRLAGSVLLLTTAFSATAQDRLLLGWPGNDGARATAFPIQGAPSGRAGEFSFVYGVGGPGNLTFTHDKGPSVTGPARFTVYLSMDSDGKLILENGANLSVDGLIKAEEVLVADRADWPDYVFKADYDLLSIDEFNEFVTQHNHLPGMPSAEEIAEHGIPVSTVTTALVKNLEELSLHVINLSKENQALQKQLARLLAD